MSMSSTAQRFQRPLKHNTFYNSASFAAQLSTAQRDQRISRALHTMELSELCTTMCPASHAYILMHCLNCTQSKLRIACFRFADAQTRWRPVSLGVVAHLIPSGSSCGFGISNMCPLHCNDVFVSLGWIARCVKFQGVV